MNRILKRIKRTTYHNQIGIIPKGKNDLIVTYIRIKYVGRSKWKRHDRLWRDQEDIW